MEDDIERLLKKNNISIAGHVLDHIKRYAMKEQRHIYMKEIEHSKGTLKNTIEDYANILVPGPAHGPCLPCSVATHKCPRIPCRAVRIPAERAAGYPHLRPMDSST